jgi:hypothetical protein
MGFRQYLERGGRGGEEGGGEEEESGQCECT